MPALRVRAQSQEPFASGCGGEGEEEEEGSSGSWSSLPAGRTTISKEGMVAVAGLSRKGGSARACGGRGGPRVWWVEVRARRLPSELWPDRERRCGDRKRVERCAYLKATTIIIVHPLTSKLPPSFPPLSSFPPPSLPFHSLPFPPFPSPLVISRSTIWHGGSKERYLLFRHHLPAPLARYHPFGRT